jgi:hypothetical protein
MKQSITRYGFAHLFEEYNRKENFSYNGRLALFDYLEELEDDTGEQIECDIIGFCCDFSEYETVEECAKEYSLWCLEPDSYEERLKRLCHKCRAYWKTICQIRMRALMQKPCK